MKNSILYKKNYLLFVMISLLFVSCEKQPSVLNKKKAFDLEAISFEENIPELYSKVRLRNEADPKYTFSTMMSMLADIKLPQKDFGYCYRSAIQLDSMVRFRSIYFNNISTLTDINKKPIAFYVEARFKEIKDRATLEGILNREYGEPLYSFHLNSDFDLNSYEWDLEDRTIQMETSRGFTSDSDYPNGIFYKMELLIVANNSKNAIYDAHIYKYKLPNSVESMDSIERKELMKDEFLLNSANEEYINDDQYKIYNR